MPTYALRIHSHTYTRVHTHTYVQTQYQNTVFTAQNAPVAIPTALRGQSTLHALVCKPHLVWSLPYSGFMFSPCCASCSLNGAGPVLPQGLCTCYFLPQLALQLLAWLGYSHYLDLNSNAASLEIPSLTSLYNKQKQNKRKKKIHLNTSYSNLSPCFVVFTAPSPGLISSCLSS